MNERAWRTGEMYCQEKRKVLGEKPFPVPIFLPKITYGLVWV
jgi:hypothetical protein